MWLERVISLREWHVQRSSRSTEFEEPSWFNSVQYTIHRDLGRRLAGGYDKYDRRFHGLAGVYGNLSLKHRTVFPKMLQSEAPNGDVVSEKMVELVGIEPTTSFAQHRFAKTELLQLQPR